MKGVTIGSADGQAVTIDPARLISTRMLVQANSGGGKSWMLRVLCERLGASIPLIVLDWEGEFASLRERLDVLLVGREGEIPTAVATAGALATQILEIGVSAVIDLYDLNPGEKRSYVRKFLESLMGAPKRLWSPRVVIVDEAHNLAPEKGEAESRDAVNALMCQGRKREFCGILATQRLSKLHKDSAAEANNVMVGRCTLDLDQERAGDILGINKAERLKLRELAAGEFQGFGPAFGFAGVKLFKSAEVQTTHGHRKGAADKPPAPSARMNKALEQLKDLAEKSKTEVFDLDSARATIKDLRRQVASKPAAPAVTAPDPKIIEERNALAERCNTLAASVKEMDACIGRIRAVVLEKTTGIVVPSVDLVYKSIPMRVSVNGHAAMPRREVTRSQATETARPRRHQAEGSVSLPIGERKTLAALIQYPDGLERSQLTVLTGYKRSSRDAYVYRLRDRGYVADSGDRITATAAGRDALPDAEPLPTGESLRDYWLARLPEGERAVLQLLIDRYPAEVEKTEIDTQTSYMRSSRDAYLNRLSAKQLVTTGRGTAKASSELFN